MTTAKVFWSGRSQAVRLPKEFRVEALEVRVRQEGKTIISRAIPLDWAWLDAWRAKHRGLDDDCIGATKEELPMQERPDLDDLFRWGICRGPIGIPPDRNIVREHPRESATSIFLIRDKILCRAERQRLTLDKNFSADKKMDDADSRA